MDPVSAAVSVTGAAGIVAGIVQILKPLLIDKALKDQTNNQYATRIFAFVVALVVVALPVYQAHGFHSQGNFLALCSVASAVAAEAILGWHVLNGKLGSGVNFASVQGISLQPLKPAAEPEIVTKTPIAPQPIEAPGTLKT